ncbi:MAG: ATP-binding protein [Thermodesulfobacteriota bacterium]
MADDTLNDNARDLRRELDWLTAVVNARLACYLGNEEGGADPVPPPPPDLAASSSPWAVFVREQRLAPAERLVLLLALTPHIRPQLLDVLFSRNEATGRGFAEFGGLQGACHGGFIPTGETAAFLVAGDDLAGRFRLLGLFDGDHLFARGNVLHLATAASNEPQLSGALVLSREYLYRFTTGSQRKPNFSHEFPARLIETRLEWPHLVLPGSVLEQLEEIRHWILFGGKLLHDWDMRPKLQPGFTSLFHGPPGTGKTLSACLLGKYCGCDVYKIDLSMIISKYIGETEKNLARIFDMAENRQWILFFDEADALFGRRTRVDDSHDRYANQEISFLLQRIEEHNGVVILASNQKANIDEAFLRRFHSVVYFPMPRPAERLRIWQNAFSAKASLEERLNLAHIAERYELAGGTIMNVVRHSSLKCLSRDDSVILREDVEEGIRREFLKQGKTL